jgi:hypothetical protein
MSDHQEIQFPGPPEGLITYPTNRIRALMDDPDRRSRSGRH